MARSIKKERWFGNANHSEKLDKRINNRMFRKKERIISNDLLQENNIVYVWSEDNESIDTEVKYPINMNEVRNTWTMAKDGKSYWQEATKKDMSK